jgi:hypothetical protein
MRRANESSRFGIRMGSIFRMEPDLADKIKDDENDDELMSLTLDESLPLSSSGIGPISFGPSAWIQNPR